MLKNGRIGLQKRGAAVLMLIIVVVIIMIAVLAGPFHQDPVTRVTDAQNNINKSAAAACAVNRNAFETDYLQKKLYNQNLTSNVNVLRQAMRIPKCPQGGFYLLDDAGKVYCTKHLPPPPELLQKLIPLTPAPAPGAAPPVSSPSAAATNAATSP